MTSHVKALSLWKIIKIGLSKRNEYMLKLMCFAVVNYTKFKSSLMKHNQFIISLFPSWCLIQTTQSKCVEGWILCAVINYFPRNVWILKHILGCARQADILVVDAYPKADWGLSKKHDSSMSTVNEMLYLAGAQGGLKDVVCQCEISFHCEWSDYCLPGIQTKTLMPLERGRFRDLQ